MARADAIANALKAIPGGARPTYAPQSSGYGRVSPVAAEAYVQNSYANSYGPFLPRPSWMFTDGAFGPMAPIQPVPVDEPPPGAQYPDPRWWEYRTGWNLPTPPGSEGLKLASFATLKTLSEKYSVARQCIQLRIDEILGLDWDVTLTTDAAKAYQGDRKAMRDFGERKAQAKRFFKRPDPNFWNFSSFLGALLQEIFVYDALSLIFRPRYGASFGMGGRGLLGSDLDSLRLVSGPTIRPLIDMHGGTPKGDAPAYQQYLYGVPRSDYISMLRETDIDDAGIRDAKLGEFSSDVMLYAPTVPRRDTPYGFPFVERALLPIVSGLQKQEFQLDFFKEGTVPAVYISPGDPAITPTQIRELQDALNSIAGDPAYHMKVLVLPPGSKVDPQKPTDLSDGFDLLVQTQVCMAADINPIELGILPNIGAGQGQGASASGIRFGAQEARDIKSRKSTKPLLKFLCDIFNHVLQEICGQPDMQFQFEGLVDDEDKQAITQLGVEQIQNGIASIDEIRERLDLPPWGLPETSEPIVITQQGPVPFSMAPQLLQATLNQGQGNDTSKLPSARRGTGGTKPNGSHPAPLTSRPSRPSVSTPAHAAAQAQISRPVRGQSGGSPSRSPVAGSRKRGEGMSPTQGRLRNKAVESELDALCRHVRKGRLISSWEPRHIGHGALAMIAEDLAKGVLLDVAAERAGQALLAKKETSDAEISAEVAEDEPHDMWVSGDGESDFDEPEMEDDEPGNALKARQWPGWEHDLGLVGAYEKLIAQAFTDAETKAAAIRKQAATGFMMVTAGTLQGLVSDVVREEFQAVMEPMWAKAWDLGYESGRALATGTDPDFTASYAQRAQEFTDSEGQHWLDQVARTGLKNPDWRSGLIARTEVARAMNAGAIAAYRDAGISHKQLLIAPDDTCKICRKARAEGIIPLDAIYAGGMPPLHPGCRCVAGPVHVAVEPPLAHLGKAVQEDETRLCWLLLRARDEDGKYRFLLQQRDDGTWGMPGGKPHVGEDPWHAAVREVTEELGTLPKKLTVARTFHHVEDDGDTQVYLYLADVAYFRPEHNGSTPEETRGAAWFRRKEIGTLDLAPKFRDDWEHGIMLREHVKDAAQKVLRRVVNENGEELILDEPAQRAQAVGSRWPYPRRSDGTEDPELEWPDAGPGKAPAAEPPRWQEDLSGRLTPRIYPRGDDDEDYPHARQAPPRASRFPGQGWSDTWPPGGIGTTQPPATGVPSGKIKGTPVTGVAVPQAPAPANPQTFQPQPYDPADAVEHLDDDGEDEIGKRRKISKELVHYRLAAGTRRCGNCVMFHAGSCDLVSGRIYPQDVCDEWEPRR